MRWAAGCSLPKLPARRKSTPSLLGRGHSGQGEGVSDRATMEGTLAPSVPSEMNESTPDPLRYLTYRGERQEGPQGGPGSMGQ